MSRDPHDPNVSFSADGSDEGSASLDHASVHQRYYHYQYLRIVSRGEAKRESRNNALANASLQEHTPYSSIDATVEQAQQAKRQRDPDRQSFPCHGSLPEPAA